MADQARWEDGLKHCEAAMSVLPSATHLPLSLWKVSDLAHWLSSAVWTSHHTTCATHHVAFSLQDV